MAIAKSPCLCRLRCPHGVTAGSRLAHGVGAARTPPAALTAGSCRQPGPHAATCAAREAGRNVASRPPRRQSLSFRVRRQTADTAARPLPLGRAPVADRPRVSKRCQPAWSSTQDHRPLWAGHPGLAVELELPLAGGAARCQPLPMTCGDQWRRAAPRGQGAGFSWPRPTAEPRPPTRLCWVTRGCLLVYGACERFPCESGLCGGRSAPASIYVTVLKTDEMSVAPSGAFGDYRQNNLKDLLNIF